MGKMIVIPNDGFGNWCPDCGEQRGICRCQRTPELIDKYPHRVKYVRWCYEAAYSALRQFYRTCKLNQFTDAELIEYKYRLWLKHGKYLDLAWQHHFSLSVSEMTGIGAWHGWLHSLPFYKFTDGRWNEWYNTAYPLPF